MDIRFTHSCAVSELALINGHTPEKIVEHVLTSGKAFSPTGMPWCAFLTFVQAKTSYNTRTPYGERLAEYIEANKLGTVVSTEMVPNPGHSTKVKAFLWTLDAKALWAWKKKNIPDVPVQGSTYRPYPPGGFNAAPAPRPAVPAAPAPHAQMLAPMQNIPPDQLAKRYEQNMQAGRP